MLPWANMDSKFCTDSYFASVPVAKEVLKHGLCFIGFIRKETRQLPMVYLSNIEFHNKGDMSELLTGTEDKKNPVLGDFVWMYQNMWYFIFTG